MDRTQLQERATQQIIRYGQAWGWQSVDLACHAAFPLAVTPELLYLLRENFLPDCPWIAIADFLLSPLCLTVGDELYEMEAIVRDILLRRLATDSRFGETRLNELADFMSAYIETKLPEKPHIARDLGTDLQWIALAYIRPGSSYRLREAITRLLQEKGASVHQRLATFLDVHEDLLVAAGLEPLVSSTHWQMKTGIVLQSFPIEVATIVFESSELEKVQKLKFETVYVNKRGEIIRTQECKAYYYEEPLEIKTESIQNPKSKIVRLSAHAEVQNLTLIAIPEGEYWMGSPEDEKDRYSDETPQHRVKVPAFFMSQTPITEAQWKFVANLPQEQKALETNPSNNGDDHPVVNISWQDAIEFCARLSRHTGRNYRLPSEAEWEYACRALPLDSESIQNTPPFHFGETITSELANYDGSVIYQEEPKGENRGKTTPFRSFKPNAFGLYDMHGNVWEWCLDPWHGNYEGAPTDGSVWDEQNENEKRYQNILDSINVLIKDDRSHVQRGGSWIYNPGGCRSAYRSDDDDRFNDYGFRVVCAPQDL